MPMSQAQVVANRQNAQESTGPKTENGRATSSWNAIKHGPIYSDIFLKSRHLTDSPEEFQEIVDSLREKLKPVAMFGQTRVMRAGSESSAMAGTEAQYIEKTNPIILLCANAINFKRSQFNGRFDSAQRDG